MRAPSRGLAILLALLPAATASAQDVAVTEPAPPFESPRSFYFELNGGKVRPAVDGQSGLSGSPYKDVFGRNMMWVFGAEFDYQIWRGFGSLAAGLAADYATVYGHGIIAATGARAADGTSLSTIPVRLLAVYRFDLLARRWNIPLIPFGKIGLAYTFWWVTNGNGSIASFQTGVDSKGDPTLDKGVGGKIGYQLSVGLALELNWIDPWLSRELDQETGINTVALQAQYLRISANNFGGKGMDLSTTLWMFGLGFEF